MRHRLSSLGFLSGSATGVPLLSTLAAPEQRAAASLTSDDSRRLDDMADAGVEDFWEIIDDDPVISATTESSATAAPAAHGDASAIHADSAAPTAPTAPAAPSIASGSRTAPLRDQAPPPPWDPPDDSHSPQPAPKTSLSTAADWTWARIHGMQTRRTRGK